MEPLRDLAYAEGPSRRLDLHRPGAGPAPLVVYIHGGAFWGGDKAETILKDEIVEAGFAYASINYRLSGEALWPAQRDDVLAAIAWLRANAARFGLDGSRVASFGESAGGHLSAFAGIALAADPATRLSAAIVWFPPVDFTEMAADFALTGVESAADWPAAESPESKLLGLDIGRAPSAAEAASPIVHLRTLPPATPLPAFLVMHGGRDELIGRGQSTRLVHALAQRPGAGNIDFHLLADGTHGGGAFAAPATAARVTGFLAAHLSED